jgi:hypothetical protein
MILRTSSASSASRPASAARRGTIWSEVADHERCEAQLVLEEVEEPHLPREVLDEILALRESRLDARQVLVGHAPAARHRRLHGVVLEVALPVDLVGLLLFAGDLLLAERVILRLGVIDRVGLRVDRAFLHDLRRHLADLCLILENRVLEHLLLDEVDQLHP